MKNLTELQKEIIESKVDEQTYNLTRMYSKQLNDSPLKSLIDEKLKIINHILEHTMGTYDDKTEDVEDILIKNEEVRNIVIDTINDFKILVSIRDIDTKTLTELIQTVEDKAKSEACATSDEDKDDSKIYISYEEIQEIIQIAPEILEGFDAILCITRGGLIPAGMLAYQLGIKQIVNINIASYSDENKQEEISIQELSKKDKNILKNSKKVLVVDDIVDSGNTLESLAKYIIDDKKLKNIDYETFAIVDKLKIADHRLFHIESNKWVVFPWDK